MTDRLPTLDQECFYIAPIGADESPERKRSDGVFDFIVKRAAEELDLVAVRADKIAEPGQITLQVVEHVLGAKAAVVDLTGLNPNVFYELAIRHTARLPVALIAEKGCTIPFDIAQMRTIFFDHTDLASADSCRSSITAHLREALDGAVDSPIATAVDVGAMQSGSVVERNVAELVTSVEDLVRAQRTSQEIVEALFATQRRMSVLLEEQSIRSRRVPRAYADMTRSVEALAAVPGVTDSAEGAKALADVLATARRLAHYGSSNRPDFLTDRANRVTEQDAYRRNHDSKVASRGNPYANAPTDEDDDDVTSEEPRAPRRRPRPATAPTRTQPDTHRTTE